MSGVSAGMLLVPLAISVIPKLSSVVVGAMVTGAEEFLTESGRYERQLRRERRELRRSCEQEKIGLIRRDIARSMNEQMRESIEVSERMMHELEANREKMLGLLNAEEAEGYQQYIERLGASRQEVTNQLYRMQDEVVKNYCGKISESMNDITAIINTQYSNYLSELQQYRVDVKAKKERAKAIAKDYIEEAEVLLAALWEDYDGERFLGHQLMELKNTLREAERQYDEGNFEAAIAVAKDMSINTLEEIYHADCKKQEWDNYYKCALAMSAELEAYMRASEVITEEVKIQAEQSTGRQLDDDIVGIRISDYTDDRKDGMKQYDYLLAKVTEIRSILNSDAVNEVSIEQMKEYVDIIGSRLYPSAAKAIYKGIVNMSNAFSRQNISEEIIDFFEDHNFNFDGYSYDDDRHDKALHIGLSNDVTGEEIVVTLAPELVGDSDVQTRVEIDQLAGDETNEERKEYYRRSIQNVVLENTPGAQIKLECNKETRNRLSSKTELKGKIKA